MMRLEELLPDLLRRWWIILIAATVAGVVGYVLVSDEPDQYSVSARMYAEAEPVDYWLDLHAKNRLATYEPLINNYAFVQEALAQARLSIDPSHAQQSLSVSHDPTRNTLTITVVNSDPARAADIANAVQSAFIRLNEEQNEALVARVEQDTNTFASRVVLTAIETAGPPAAPVASGVRSTVVAAAMLGAIAGGLVVVFLVYRDDALRSTEDVERHLARPLLAVVPKSHTSLER
ncbi:Wzz/FepE/Etk N-terminal domain-containing protein [soil metagenome]